MIIDFEKSNNYFVNFPILPLVVLIIIVNTKPNTKKEKVYLES